MHPPASIRLRAGLIAAVVLGVALVYIVFIGTARGRSVDQSLLDHIAVGKRESAGDALVALLNVVTAPLLGLAIVFAALRNRGWRTALGIAVVIVGSTLTAEALKAVLSHFDPLDGESKRELGSHFFPSGHAALTMALCIGAVVATPLRWRCAVALIAFIALVVLGGAIFVSRDHYASDVLGGFLVAIGWSAALLGVTQASSARPNLRRSRSPRPPRRPGSATP